MKLRKPIALLTDAKLRVSYSNIEATATRVVAKRLCIIEILDESTQVLDPSGEQIWPVAEARDQRSEGVPSKASEAAAFTKTLTDDSENEPPDFKTPGDDFGVGEAEARDRRSEGEARRES